MMAQSWDAPSRRPAAFFDRDGVLNHDFGYVHRPDQLQWISGAADAIRRCNKANFFVFIVTNQAGVAHGYYDETAITDFHDFMRAELAEHDAKIDDIRYCPFHPSGKIDAYRKRSAWRKPGPGMLEDLMDHWPVDISRSFLVGDKKSDIDAATACKIPAHLFEGGNLDDFIKPILTQITKAAA